MGKKIKKTNCQKKEGKSIVFSTKVEECLDKDLETTIHNGGLKIMRKYFI